MANEDFVFLQTIAGSDDYILRSVPEEIRSTPSESDKSRKFFSSKFEINTKLSSVTFKTPNLKQLH